MRYLIIAAIILSSSSLYSQQRQAVKTQIVDEITFLDTLGKKNIATQGDAIALFTLVMDKKQPSSAGIPNGTPLTKGYIAHKVADKLNLKDSLFYRIFGTERYAFRACVAYRLMNEDGSENDLMSGEELIEFLRLASEYIEKGAAK